ncbi:beta-Ala-His dipeptidase [Clostridium sp. MD294]|uniref:beta-Ala-His dipeptidase n=1 Tax=Clostridium sp. MD294 TaxID=97138 RepID=UPI0002C9075B|nr:beta-Ala-His dipeptidase [Clostridium sp. MD294]NDO47092.1 aminoacyl-histidine dipeptidase [Clostridium sp. MD294]USF31138.1 Cytosol non-specific dipeptidase [Clostridium sp. MD294]
MNDIHSDFWRDIIENHPLEYFKKIVQIPHRSTDETNICQSLIYFAQQHCLHWEKDEAGNLLIQKEGTTTQKQFPVILQAHMDMVFETEDIVQYPYEKAIHMIQQGDIVKAKGTSLGADNGLGIAIILAILASKNLQHPSIEALFTVEEEDGLIGASKIQKNWLRGKYLINLDGEEENVVVAGCAGAFRSEIQLPIVLEKIEQHRYFMLQICGIYGGHSGLDIHKNRKNAIVLLQRLLIDIYKEITIRICKLDGGSRMNAIPTKAEAVIAVPESLVSLLGRKILELEKEIKVDLIKEDMNFKFSFSEVLEQKCCNAETTKNIFQIFSEIPNGILERYDNKINSVKTSSNVGIVETKDNMMIWISNTRSSSKNSLDKIMQQKQTLANKSNANVIFDSYYPAWEYQKHSSLRELYIKIYEKLYSNKLHINVIHAGLECGILLEKFSDIDAISVGSNIWDVHSVSEHFSKASFERIWNVIQKVLLKLCEKE